MNTLADIFKKTHDAVDARSLKEALTDGHKAQLDALKLFVDALAEMREFYARLNLTGAVPVLSIANQTGLGASFLISFGSQGFNGPVTLRLLTLPEGHALNNVDDGYDLTTEEGLKALAENVATAVARGASRGSLQADAAAYLQKRRWNIS